MPKTKKDERPLNIDSYIRQQRLADRHHKCTCEPGNVTLDPTTTRLADVDFDHADREEPAGRMIWYTSKCTRCGKVAMYGKSFTDYRATGQALIDAAMQNILVTMDQVKRAKDLRPVLVQIMKKQNPQLTLEVK